MTILRSEKEEKLLATSEIHTGISECDQEPSVLDKPATPALASQVRR